MSIETEIASLTTAIRNLTDVLLASAAKALPAPTATANAMPFAVDAAAVDAAAVEQKVAAGIPAPEPKKAPNVIVARSKITPDGTVVVQVPKDSAFGAAAMEALKKEAAPAPVPEAPTVSEDDLRVQIVELARPNMGDAAFKAFLGGKLAELQGAPCSISGTGKLPKIDAAHLPTLLAAINKQLGK